MNKKRVCEIVENREIKDVYYEDRPVWIQEVIHNVAKVGFIDNNEEKDVFVEDLYEVNLYNE